MDWLFLSLASMLLFSVSTLQQRHLLKDEDSDSVHYSIIFQFLCSIVTILVVAFLGAEVFPKNILSPFYLLMGVGYGGFSLFLFKALKYTDASNVTILISTRVFWVILIEVIFFGNIIEGKQLLGCLLIFISVLIIYVKKAKITFNKGDVYALAAGLFQGLGIIADSVNLKGVSALTYLPINFILPTIFLIVVSNRNVKRVREFGLKTYQKVFIISVVYITAVLLYLFALQRGGTPSQLGGIGMVGIPMTAVLSYIFLNEREDLGRKVLGVIFASLGVLLIQ